MPAVVKCVANKSKANVTADYENIKYYFQAPQDQDPTGSSHWETYQYGTCWAKTTSERMAFKVMTLNY